MPYTQQIERILQKLDEARARGIETFGAEDHAFTLAAPLTEEEVTAFERAHGVELPADFRAFVTQAGGSGAGPYYGLLPPDRWLSGGSNGADALRRPCLFTPDTPRSKEVYESLAGDAAAPFQGAIAIVDQGCTFYAMLLVSGSHRGRVMYVNVDGGVPFFVENTDFLSWYERWLDELLWGHEHHWFGMDMPGDEATLAAASRTGEPRRRDALAAMYRLSRLADTTVALVIERIRDDDAAVRAAALSLVQKHRIGSAEAQVRRALGDYDGSARRAALAALIAIGADWKDDARAALRDPDPEVARRALWALTKARAVSAEEVLPLLDVPELEITAMSELGRLPSERAVTALLIRARAGATPDLLHALVAQVRAGAAAPSQEQEVLDLLLTQFANVAVSDPTGLVSSIGAFVKGHPRALATLLDATKHGDGFVRFDAACVLGDVGGEEAVPALVALSTDETMPRTASRGTVWSVGESAKRALAKLDARLMSRSG